MSLAEEATRDLTEKVKRVPREVIMDLDRAARMIDGFIASFQVDSRKRATQNDVMRSTKQMYDRVLRNGKPHKGTVISINKLKENAQRENSKVEQLSEPMTEDLMKYYKEYCRKAGVQYSILRERKKDRKDTYYVFFKSKDAGLVKGCIERGMKAYLENTRTRGVDETKESVIEKIEKYAKIVKENDAKKEAKEKTHRKSEMSK